MRENVEVASMVRLGKKDEVARITLLSTNHTESSAGNVELLSRDLGSFNTRFLVHFS